jgi:ribonuclease VapC
MFVDASVWIAILANEPEADAFEARLLDTPHVLISAIVTWETVRALAKIIRVEPEDARALAFAYVAQIGAQVASIGEDEQVAALDAFARFGKGRHPARLNMGDCFAYACARTNGVPLLYKGGDFALTDIEAA